MSKKIYQLTSIHVYDVLADNEDEAKALVKEAWDNDLKTWWTDIIIEVTTDDNISPINATWNDDLLAWVED